MSTNNQKCKRLIGQLLRIVRLRGGFEQQRLAGALDVSQPTISRWEMGHSAPSAEQVQVWVALCRGGIGAALATDVEEVLVSAIADQDCAKSGDRSRVARNTERLQRLLADVARGDGDAVYEQLIPYYADVAAGVGEFQEVRSAPRRELGVPGDVYARDPGCYALRVSGDSMAPQLLDGDIVVVSPAAALVDGCIVAAYIEPDGDVVKLYRELPGGTVMLQPANPAYPVVMLGGEDGHEARIWGRVVLSQREL